MNHRGEVPTSETGHVAIVIILIALLMVGYFILLPGEEKTKLLDIKETKEGEITSILSETPGHIYPYTREIEEERLAPLNLFSQVKTSAQRLANRVYVKRNIFTGQPQTLDFTLDDLGRIQSLGLFFNLVRSRGDLVVILNNNEIFRGELQTGDLPVDLPVKLLKINNELEIYVSNPSWRILSTNYYELKDVQLIRSFNMENKYEERSFIIYDKDKVKKSGLTYYISCMDAGLEQGNMNIELNGINIFSGRTLCTTDHIRLAIDKGYLRNGQNTLTFEIDKGNYMFEQVILSLDLEKEYYPEYYFAVDEKDGDYELIMDFAGDEVKRATIMLNNQELTLATEDMDYSKDITDYVKEGENHIKIIGLNEFTITNLEIVQEK